MIRKNLVFVLPLIIFSLLAAIWGGWLRIGWDLPVIDAAAQHGALMVNSFLASLIFLERAVTFKQKWILLLPLINAASLLPFLMGLPREGFIFLTLASAGFVWMCGYFIIRYKELYFLIFLGGAACLLTGNLLLISGRPYAEAVAWWMGFLLLTIVAERLELTRFLKMTALKKNLLIFFLFLFFVGLLWPAKGGNILRAAAFAGSALWLLRFDMARRAVKLPGLHRYTGILLLTGYVWLFITALLLGLPYEFVFSNDAILHSFFIGFVFSMIFSHAPIIFPAVAGLPIKIYRPVLYGWFLLLQFSLVMRIMGDLMESNSVRKAGGGFNGLVLLGFFISVAVIAGGEIKKYKAMRRSK